MALSIFETAFGKDRTSKVPSNQRGRRRFDYSKGQYVESGSATRDAFADTAGRTLHAVQMVCDALIPPSQGRYSVAFGGRTASTERGVRRITVTPQPLYMKGLRLADVADTLTGFVVHEIGHVAISADTDREVEDWLASEPGYLPWMSSIHAISNVLDDHALEVWAKRRFPGVGHTFRVTTKFVAQEQGLPNKPPRKFDPKGSYVDRFNFMVVAVRYRWFARWISDPITRRERDWWIDWAETYGDPTDAKVRLAGIKAGIARLAIKPENRPPEEQTPEPEPTEGDDEVEPTEDEPETFDTEPEGEDEDDEDGDDEGDEDGESEDWDDDDDDDTTSGGNDDDDDTEDEDDEPEGDGDEGQPDDAESDDDEPGDGASADDDEGEDEGEGSPSEHTPLGDLEDGTAEPQPYDDEGDPEQGEDPDDDDYDGSEDDADGDESEGTDESGKAGLDAGNEGEDTTDDDEDDDEGEDDDDREDGGDLSTSEDALGQAGEGSDSAPIYEGFEPENLRDAIQTVDAYNEERTQWDRHRDEALQEQVEVEMRATKVTDPNGYGEMKVVINL